MPTQQNIWNADWQPYNDDEDPFAGDWEATDQAGPANPWEGDWQEDPFEADWQEVAIKPVQAGAIPETDTEAMDYPKLLAKGVGTAVKGFGVLGAIRSDPMAIGGMAAEAIGEFADSEKLRGVGKLLKGASPHLQTVEAGRQAEEYWEEKLSPGMKAEREKPFVAKDEEGYHIGPGLKSPQKIASTVVESIPSSVVGMGGGAVIAKGLISAGIGITKGMAGVIGGAIGEGLMSGTGNAEEIYQQIMKSPAKQLRKMPVYQEVLNALPEDMPKQNKERLTKKILALSGSSFVGSITTLTTGLLGAPSGHAMGKLVGGDIGKSLWRNVLWQAVSEGLIEEAPQSGVEQYVNNLTVKALANAEQELGEGVLESMVGGAVAGAAMGGGMAVGFREAGKAAQDTDKVPGDESQDLLKTGVKSKQLETKLREDFNTGKISSTQLGYLKAQYPRKHPLFKVIDDLLKESEATTPEKDMMTGDILNLKPEDFIPEQAIPEMTTPEALAPEQEDGFSKFINFQPREEFPSPQEAIPGAFQPRAEKSAQESAQVFEQDREARVAAQVERQRIEDEQAAQEEQQRRSAAGKEPLKEQLRAKEEASAIEGMEYKVPYIRGILEHVKGAEAGKRIRVTDYDGTEKWFGVKSEFPEFMKNRYSKKEVVKAIEKGLAGYQFPENEVRLASIWEDVKSEAYQMRNRDLKLAGEMYIEEPTTIEGLPDREYKLLITELQHEGYSTREIEEIAARHRKKIEGDVIASIGNQYGFSKEEIQAILDDPMEPASDLDGAWKEAMGRKPVEAYLTPIAEGEEYDLEKERRIPRRERKGQEPGRAVPKQEAGKRQAGPSGVLQTSDQVEQKAQLIAKLINEKLLPGHDLKYDGTWPGVDNLWQFTPYAKTSPAYKATFAVIKLEADTIYEGLQKKIKDFTEHPPEDFNKVIDLAAKEAETKPTEAQIQAGNYRHGHINIQGLDISIENPKGSVRSGVDRSGKKWSTTMQHHYGYIRRTEGRDREQVDVFVGDEVTSEKVFIVNQVDPETKKFDENKVMIGFPDEKAARLGYQVNYQMGWQGLGNIVSLSMDEFKAWLKEGDQTKKAPEAIEVEKEPAKKPVESIKEVFESPSATQAEVIKEKAKLKAQLIEGIKSGEFTGAVRFGTVDELKDAIKEGKLPVSKLHGVIHAQPIMGKDDDTFAAYGAYDKHNMAYIIPTEHLQEKIDAHTKEVLVNPDTPLENLTFLIDGHEKAYSYDELLKALGEEKAEVVAKPVSEVEEAKKVEPRGREGLVEGKEGEIKLTNEEILANAGLTVTKTLTTPKKAGKKPRAVWEVAGRLEPYLEIIRDLGGRKWGGKYSFWGDPTVDLAEAVGVQGGMSFAEQQEAKKVRAGEKAERLADRAGKAGAKAEGARKAGDRISDMIPMGQPILVGHHSEGRARRDQDRIHNLMRKQIDEGDKAVWLADRARLQREVAKGEYSIRFMENRVDEAEADVRRLERILSGEHYGADPLKNQTYRDRIARNLADAQEKVEFWKQGIEDAGGINYSKDNLKKGDRVKIRGAWCAVLRANPKTVSIVVAEGGAKGMKLKYKYSEITESDIPKPAAKQVEIPAVQAAIPETVPAKVEIPVAVPPKVVALDKKQKAKIASLRKGADNLQKQINGKRNPAVAGQNLTRRRAGQIASASADADRLERIQMVMRGLADDTENGTLLDMLENISTKVEIEQILFAKRFSHPSFHRSHMTAILDAAKGVKGMADERVIIQGIARRRRDDYQIDLFTTVEIKAVEAAIKQSPTNLNHIKLDIAEGKRLMALGIKDQQHYDTVRNRLLEYTSPPSPITQTQAKIRAKEAELIGVKIPGFFPTPGPVAALMVEAADIQPGDLILEPSAGKGDLAAVIKEAHPESKMQVAEIGYAMREILELKGFDIIGVDFLDMKLSAPGVQGLDVAYNKIVMNPPFEFFADIDHVKHAFDLLAPGGRLVSLMGEGAFFRSEKKAADFRLWLDKVGAEDHKLADKSFTGKEAFRQTGTAARMVVIDKPGEKVVKKKTEKLFQKQTGKPITVHDVKQAQKALNILKNTLSKVLPPDMMANVTAHAAPILELDLTREDTQKSLQDWGGDIKSISGATTINDFHALVEIAYNHDNNALESTSYHEAFHVACKWILPNKDYADLMRYFKDNEENAADAFAGFAMERKGQELNTHPNFIKAIFLKLRRYFQMLRNALQGKGFARPEDVFGKLMVGDYKVALPISVRQDRLVHTAQTKGGIEYSWKVPEKYYSTREMTPEPMQSQLVMAVENAQDLPKKAASLSKWLEKHSKPEEIKWLNVEDYIKTHVRQDGTIDRAAFLDYLKSSQIIVGEAFRFERGSKGNFHLDWSTPEWSAQENLFAQGEVETDYDMDTVQDDFTEYETYAVHPESQDVYTIIGSEAAGYNLFFELGQGPGEKHHIAYYGELEDAKYSAEAELEERFDNLLPETRYDVHTITGGSDYTELLLVHPPTGEVKNVHIVVAAEGEYQVKNTETGNVYPEKEPPGYFYDDYNEALGRAQSLNMDLHKYGLGNKRPTYSSPHWEQPDVLAHIRFKTRLDENHGKILFIEEIQSDWHQAGKKYGYSGDPSRPGPVLTIVPNTGQLGDSPAGSRPAKYWAMANGVILAGGQTEGEARINAAGVLDETTDERLKQPPPAPFGKTWHELSMKRMLRYAAENGFDSMAWTTGEQQIERYDLKKHIDLVTWKVSDTMRVDYGILTRSEERAARVFNPRVIVAGFKKGAEVFARGLNVLDELDEFIGKNISDQIRTGLNQGKVHGSIDATGLTVGGEGMVAFYDNLLPGFMRKYGKQWGATVEQTEIVTGRRLVIQSYLGKHYTVEELEALNVRVDEANAVRPQYVDGIRLEGLPPLFAGDALALQRVIAEMKFNGGSFTESMFLLGTDGLAMFLNGKIVKGWADIKEPVHSVTITPEMRESVLFTGQTLFNKAKDPSHGQAWARQYIADALADAVDKPNDKEAQAKAERIRTEQTWFKEEWPRAAYQSAKDVIKAFKMGKKEGWVGMRPDTTFLERWLQSPEFYFEKVPAAWRVFMASLERQDDRNQFYNDLTQKDVLLAEVINFKKADPGEYGRLQKLMIRADQIKAVHGPKSLRELGFSDQAITAFLAFRQMMDNGFDALYAEMAQIIQDYEEAGLPLPEVATWVGDKQILVNLKMALALMGNMRGWYFPRQRKSGDWMVIATKKGANPIMEIFELAGFANLRCTELQKQGYNAYKKNTKKLPEDVYQLAGRTIGLNAMINMALARTIPEKMPTFEEFGLKQIMRTTPSGRKDFIVRGPTNKKTNEVLKMLGGRNFSSAPGEPRAWHFTDAPDDMGFRVLRALITSKGIAGAAESDLLFAHAITTEVANVIKGRGFRSAMVGRRPETGEKVWVGYDTDLVEVASRYVTGLSSGLAKKQVASKMVQAVTGTDIKPTQFESFEAYLDEIKARRIDPDKQKNIFHDCTTYIEEMLRNQEFSDRVIGVIKGITVLKYLGFRLASPLVNLTAFITSVPATMHGLANIPILDTFKYLVKAIEAYHTYAYGKKDTLDPDLVEMFDYIRLKGWDNAQHNMEALAVLRSKLGGKWKWLMEKAMFIFGATEKLNRVATIMGTYMALKEQGMGNVDERRALSKRVSDRAHGTYGKTTYPYIAQGKKLDAKIAQSMYVFGKFSHTYLQNMYDLGYKRHQWQSLLYMAFAPAIIAGTGSIPFVWPLLMGALREIFGVDEPEERFYSWFDDNLGEFAGNVARYGIAGAGGYGVSLKGSLAIDPIQGVPTKLPEILGAPGNVFTDLWDGGKSLFQGDWVHAGKVMGPRVTGSMIQAYEEQVYGVTTRKRTPKFLKGKKMEPERFDTILRFFNFNPAHMAKIKEQKWSEQRLVAKYRDLRSDIYSRIRGYYHKPMGLRSEGEYLSLLADVDEYNKRVAARDLDKIYGISYMTKQSIKTALKIKK